jgi:DNA-binding NtrC family response regulator
MPRFLIVDDESRYCQIVNLLLRPETYEVVTATEGREAARLLDEQTFDLILSDLFMEPYNGLDRLRHRNSNAPEVPFIALTAFGSISSAVELIKEGGYPPPRRTFSSRFCVRDRPSRSAVG